MQGAVSLTFCDSGENHVGMRMLGKKVDIGQGFNKEDLLRAMENFKNGLYFPMAFLLKIFTK